MIESEKFQHFIKKNKFVEIEPNLFECKRNNYFVMMQNNIDSIFKYNAPPDGLFMDIYCDNSELTKTQIKEIEKSNFIVTPNSIRKHTENLFKRFNLEEIDVYLNDLFEMVDRFDIEALEKEDS